MPPGALFRGGVEGKIRRRMLEADLIEAVIALPRKLLFNHILFVDASEDFEPRRSRNRLRNADVTGIVRAIRDFREEPGRSAVADHEALQSANYDLNLARWVEHEISHAEMDFGRELAELGALEEERDRCAAAIDEMVVRVARTGR